MNRVIVCRVGTTRRVTSVSPGHDGDDLAAQSQTLGERPFRCTMASSSAATEVGS